MVQEELNDNIDNSDIDVGAQQPEEDTPQQTQNVTSSPSSSTTPPSDETEVVFGDFPAEFRRRSTRMTTVPDRLGFVKEHEKAKV